MSEDQHPLEFEDDPGAGRATWVALAIIVAALARMLSGFVLPSGDEDAFGRPNAGPGRALSVATQVVEAKEITLYFRA